MQEFFRALSLVRSRTFSGPYVASSLSDRGRLAALVGALVVVNTALGGDLSKGFGAAAAVFLFNVIYEVVLSNKLKQYAMCPIIDLLNHSSYNTVRTAGRRHTAVLHTHVCMLSLLLLVDSCLPVQ